MIYRVSINSFPDYKHLLQENYVEYKHMHDIQGEHSLSLITNTYYKKTTWNTNICMIYRVSIKSFPDYKHLLQEIYVEYKHMHDIQGEHKVFP